MDRKELESALEAILFASGEPVQVDRICVALDIDRPTVEQLLQKLMDYYAYERRGIRLLKIDDSWQLCSAPDYAETIRKAFEIRKPAKLSQPALEVLTIIAYYQPTTRAYVDQIRGVRIDPLDVSVILGGQAEPADAAQLYGELHGAVWTGMPVLEQLLVIPRPHIHLDVDFTAEETKILGSVGFSARIGTLLRIGMTVAIPGLRWLLAYMKKKKQAPVGKDESNGHGKETPAA